ncbi:MAG: hypothetical protein QXN53_03835 [Thermoproteota archaeon]
MEKLEEKASSVRWFNEKRKGYFCLICKRLNDKKGYLVFDLDDFEGI